MNNNALVVALIIVLAALIIYLTIRIAYQYADKKVDKWVAKHVNKTVFDFEGELINHLPTRFSDLVNLIKSLDPKQENSYLLTVAICAVAEEDVLDKHYESIKNARTHEAYRNMCDEFLSDVGVKFAMSIKLATMSARERMYKDAVVKLRKKYPAFNVWVLLYNILH